MRGGLKDLKLIFHEFEVDFIALELFLINDFHSTSEHALDILGFLNLSEGTSAKDFLHSIVLFDIIHVLESLKIGVSQLLLDSFKVAPVGNMCIDSVSSNWSLASRSVQSLCVTVTARSHI